MDTNSFLSFYSSFWCWEAVVGTAVDAGSNLESHRQRYGIASVTFIL